MSSGSEKHKLTSKELQSLRELVDQINNYQGEWYKEVGGGEIKPGEYEMPFTDVAPLARKAMQFLYDNKLIQEFDWGSWDEGREFFKDDDDSKYEKLDREWVLKLLTAIARSDRFSDGAWGSLFESGSAQKLFRRLLEIEES